MVRIAHWPLVTALAAMLFVACGPSDTIPKSTPSPQATDAPASGRATPTPTPTASPTPTPRPKFSDFDFEVGQGTFWEYRWSYTDRSCAQGSGCSTKKDEGRFQVTLGAPREIQGVTTYEVQLSGKHRVALPGVTRDFAPRWRYLAVSDNRILGSSGSALTVLFDGLLGKWAGSGYFTDRFNANELIEARTSSISQNEAIADWPGVKTGTAIAIGRASSQSQCEVIEGLRICPREETFSSSERELYRGGIGPVAYFFQFSTSFSGGNFFSSYQTTENVGLVASSLRGDAASLLDEASGRLESEPNNNLAQAQRLALPANVVGDILNTDTRAEVRFYDSAAGEWLFLELQDIYRFTVSEQRPVTVTLTFTGSTSADLNLLLLTPSEIDDEDTILILS